MRSKINVKSEFELYKPMCKWLEEYLKYKYKGFEIITYDSHAERLDKVLNKFGIKNELAIGLDIQIDVLGIASKNDDIKLFFIEAKKTNLILKDLGQLWSYCKLIDPEEAFLMSSLGFGSLNKILNVFKREDLLEYGNNKNGKKIKVVLWDLNSSSPQLLSMIPKT